MLFDNDFLSVYYIHTLGQALQAIVAAHHLSVHVEYALYAALVGRAIAAAVDVVDARGAILHAVDHERDRACGCARQLKPAAERLQSVLIELAILLCAARHLDEVALVHEEVAIEVVAV